MDLSVGGSDTASDAAYVVTEAMVVALKKEFKEKGNSYNTGGVENVAMIFHQHLVPGNFARLFNDHLYDMALKTLDALEKLIKRTNKEKWEDRGNKEYHLACYKDWQKSLKKFIKDSRL
jgi:hypothetical protein